jgi:tRNA(adenine34) deaminase
LQDGARVVVPDMVGFGKSDKPKKASFHSTHWHRQNLLELLERLKLQNLSWVVQGEHPWGLASPDCLRDLPVASSALVRWHELAALPLVGLGPPTAVATNNAVCPWQAPFPNAGYRAGFTAFQSAQHEGVEPSGHGLQ